MTLAPLALVTRSGFVEGVHHGSATGVDQAGKVVVAAGEPDAAVLPRSSLKPLQLLAMLRAGLELHGPLLALAAASHSGEPFHLAGVERILHAGGFTEADLGNAPDLPYGPDERLRWQCSGRAARPLAQNCSGKHAAMLLTCAVNGWPVTGYLSAEHPLQRLALETVAELAGEPVTATAVDGCGAPAFGIGLTGLARAFGVLAVAAPDTPEGAIAGAIRAHPDYLGGTGRDVTDLIRAVPGLIAKDGAEGVYAAALPDGRAAALKIADGSERARPAVMVELLRVLGLADPHGSLARLAGRPVLGHGRPVGSVSAVPLAPPNPQNGQQPNQGR